MADYTISKSPVYANPNPPYPPSNLEGLAPAPGPAPYVNPQYSSAETPYNVVAYPPPVLQVDMVPPEPLEPECTVGRWENGFCSCFDSIIPNCCMVTCCRCISISQIMARMGWCRYSTALVGFVLLWVIENAASSAAANSMDMSCWFNTSDDDYYSSYSSYHYYHTYDWYYNRQSCVFEYSSLFGFYWIITYLISVGMFVLIVWMRMRVRERFQIPGSCCCDFFAACCCPCCTVAQLATHVKSYNPGSCDFGAKETLLAYA